MIGGDVSTSSSVSAQGDLRGARWGAKVLAAWRAIRVPFLIFVSTRAGLFLLAYLSLALVEFPADMPAGRWLPTNLFLDGWGRWDAAWYAQIAAHGYSNLPIGPEGQRNLAFYPLYPLVVSIFNVVIRHPLLSTIVVSNLAALAAFILLYRLVDERFGSDTAAKSVLLLAVYPFSFYLSAGYSEALFLLLIVAAMYAAEKQKWWLAGLAGLLAGATRVPGVALFPALALRYFEGVQYNWRKVRPNALPLVLAVCGPLAFFLFLWVQFGDPLIQLKALRVPGWWEHGLNLPGLFANFAGFFRWPNALTGAYPVMPNLNVVMAALFLFSTLLVFRWLPPSYGVLSLLLIGFGMAQWIGWGRYVMAAFPVFIAWAIVLRKREVFEVVLIVSALLLALLTIMYTHWYWVS
jgi:Gpi18-like mannosyltransferase